MIKRVADAAVLMYDDDGAGHKATVKVARMLLAMEMPVRVVALPGGDDPDSFLRAHPPSDLRSLIDGAESIVAFQFRTARAAEPRPDSIDAVSRVSRSLLETMAACPSAILKATLVNEASRLLRVPAASLSEDLARIKPEPFAKEPARVRESAPPPPDAAESEIAAQDVPPPPRERALMAFLLANEYDKTLDGMIGSFLPYGTFVHSFTSRFVETWRNETAEGEDMMGAFADSLPPAERGWFDAILEESGHTAASAMSETDIMQDFVRSLWTDRLRRERGELPASGGDAADERRMKLSMDMKRLASARWSVVKQMIGDFRLNETVKGQK